MTASTCLLSPQPELASLETFNQPVDVPLIVPLVIENSSRYLLRTWFFGVYMSHFLMLYLRSSGSYGIFLGLSSVLVHLARLHVVLSLLRPSIAVESNHDKLEFVSLMGPPCL